MNTGYGMLIWLSAQLVHKSDICVWTGPRPAHSAWCEEVQQREDAAGSDYSIDGRRHARTCHWSLPTDRMNQGTDRTDLVGALKLQAPAAARTRRTGLALDRKAGTHSGGAEIWPAHSAEQSENCKDAANNVWVLITVCDLSDSQDAPCETLQKPIPAPAQSTRRSVHGVQGALHSLIPHLISQTHEPLTAVPRGVFASVSFGPA